MWAARRAWHPRVPAPESAEDSNLETLTTKLSAEIAELHDLVVQVKTQDRYRSGTQDNLLSNSERQSARVVPESDSGSGRPGTQDLNY
jgi:hypothetical protein